MGERFERLAKSESSSHVTSDPCDPTWCGVCGGTDDRVPSTDPAVGRISGIRTDTGAPWAVASGWIASNGAYITAGHVFSGTFTHSKWLEFNVPPSGPDGTMNFPHPDYQYSIDETSIVREHLFDCVTADWAVFKCFPNSNTGLLPVQAQDAFYRLSLDSNPSTFRLTGYGLDECPPGTGPNQRNSNSNTQQTATGPRIGSGPGGSGNFFYWDFSADIRVGNSGCPVIPEGTGLSVGIQICCTQGCPNLATSFDSDGLETAVNVFPGTNIMYADNGHPNATGSGTVFRPFNTVVGAVNAVPAGGLVSVVKGSYNESMTINKALTITAPVGNVTIGPSAPPKLANDNFEPEDEQDYETAKAQYHLSQNYPNPFNPTTTIEYSLPKPCLVKLVIYDMLGQEVRTLVNGLQQQGINFAVWDGKNDQGKFVPSGLYIYNITTDGFIQSSKAVLLR